MTESDGRLTARIELPQFTAVPMFLDVLECLELASLACRLPALIVAGYLPPADATVELTTVTPDPAVIEINTAPSVDAESFLWRSREIYAAAADQGLAPYRLYFNGTVALLRPPRRARVEAHADVRGSMRGPVLTPPSEPDRWRKCDRCCAGSRPGAPG